MPLIVVSHFCDLLAPTLERRGIIISWDVFSGQPAFIRFRPSNTGSISLPRWGKSAWLREILTLWSNALRGPRFAVGISDRIHRPPLHLQWQRIKIALPEIQFSSWLLLVGSLASPLCVWCVSWFKVWELMLLVLPDLCPSVFICGWISLLSNHQRVALGRDVNFVVRLEFPRQQLRRERIAQVCLNRAFEQPHAEWRVIALLCQQAVKPADVAARKS